MPQEILLWATGPKRKKSIIQKLIHDADCLDILRARDHFEAEYLDIYKQYVGDEKNMRALFEIARLITEARCILDIQGDSRNHTKAHNKKLYENENAYNAIIKSIYQNHFQILPQMYGKGELLEKKH